MRYCHYLLAEQDRGVDDRTLAPQKVGEETEVGWEETAKRESESATAVIHGQHAKIEHVRCT